MSEFRLLQALRQSAEARRILEFDFDFRAISSPAIPGLFQLCNNTGYEVIGTDASGGEFALCDAGSLKMRPLLYVSSEGQAGIIARSLENGLSLIIDLEWGDCLHFSDGGRLAEMRQAATLSESDLVARTPNIMSSRQAVRNLLALTPVSDSVGELHSALVELSPLYPVCAPDGCQFESLFGRFSVMSNGEWRRRLTHQA
jgi:hypothetical protein